jgi:hypothetical protein
MKTWTTGSVGAATSALDAMQIHMLSERWLILLYIILWQKNKKQKKR